MHFYISETQKHDIDHIYSEKEHVYLEYVNTPESQAKAQEFLLSHKLMKSELAQLETHWKTAWMNSWHKRCRVLLQWWLSEVFFITLPVVLTYPIVCADIVPQLGNNSNHSLQSQRWIILSGTIWLYQVLCACRYHLWYIQITQLGCMNHWLLWSQWGVLKFDVSLIPLNPTSQPCLQSHVATAGTRHKVCTTMTPIIYPGHTSCQYNDNPGREHLVNWVSRISWPCNLLINHI